MDQHICYEDKPYHGHNPNSAHILADILSTDHPDILVSKSIDRPDIGRWHRMEMDYMGLWGSVHFAAVLDCNWRMGLQYSHRGRCRLGYD